ncbi:MAG: chorismate mutase [Planctomycetaceae bacterium]|nr:chorismate mutase [Planctomycetaceae bacterium]
MLVRGVRGAISADKNTREAILQATTELLKEVLRANEIDDFEYLVSAVFTTSPDLTASFPAEAARDLGMSEVPLLCASEIAVPNSLKMCIRVLLHVNTDKKQSDIVHVYMKEAAKLRPDMTSAQ